jgi:hypothetical protein
MPSEHFPASPGAGIARGARSRGGETYIPSVECEQWWERHQSNLIAEAEAPWNMETVQRRLRKKARERYYRDHPR